MRNIQVSEKEFDLLRAANLTTSALKDSAEGTLLDEEPVSIFSGVLLLSRASFNDVAQLIASLRHNAPSADDMEVASLIDRIGNSR